MIFYTNRQLLNYLRHTSRSTQIYVGEFSWVLAKKKVRIYALNPDDIAGYMWEEVRWHMRRIPEKELATLQFMGEEGLPKIQCRVSTQNDCEWLIRDIHRVAERFCLPKALRKFLRKIIKPVDVIETWVNWGHWQDVDTSEWSVCGRQIRYMLCMKGYQ